MPASWRSALVVLGAAVVCAAGASAEPQASAHLETLMARVGARVAEYYRRAQSVICLERSTVQPVHANWAAEGFARTVESELRVEAAAPDGDTPSAANVVRTVRRVNGRPPVERDLKDRSGCTDPNPLSPEPLAFLLPERQREYRFTSSREGKERNRAAVIVDFLSANRASRPQLIEDRHGHDDCFDWSGPLASRGRIWIDAETYDVLRIERHVDGPIDVEVPPRLQRRYSFGPYVVLDRDDQTVRYKPVTFQDPPEVMLLPSSIESLTILRAGLQSIRRTDTYSNYRRFLGEGRVVK
mgnify:CR=1 FL=1